MSNTTIQSESSSAMEQSGDQPSMASALSALPSGSEDNIGGVTKRKFVDVSGSELADPKRNRADTDDNLKSRAIYLMLHWHEYLCRVFNYDDDGWNRIDGIADLTAIIFTAHTKFRQNANGTRSVDTLITDDFEFQANGYKVKWGVIGPKMKTLGSLYGFNYEVSESGKNATGTLGSILALITSFTARFNEVRVGTTNITLRKTKDTVQQVPIAQFGLRQEHSVLTTGSSYNPSVQSSMKYSLGPMTTAINLTMQTDREYQESWKKRFCQTFKLIPNAQKIANALAGSKNDEIAIMTNLADIALFGAIRASNKASFPFAMLLTVARRKDLYRQFFSHDLPNTPITGSIVHDAIRGMDFSAAGAFRFWNMAQHEEFRIRATESMSSRIKSEMIFHACWGTQKEDLSLLKFLTGHDFLNRSGIGEALENRGRGPETGTFRLIRFEKVCKLASASHTTFLSEGKGQISRGSTFSGYCIQRVDLNGALFKALSNDIVEFRDRGGPKEKLLTGLHRIKEKIKSQISQKPSIAFDTTNIYKFSASEGYGEAINDVPELTGNYFYGQED